MSLPAYDPDIHGFCILAGSQQACPGKGHQHHTGERTGDEPMTRDDIRIHTIATGSQPLTPAPTNAIGWTRVAEAWVGPWLDDQLTEAGIEHTVTTVPEIAGMGGEARVIRYWSPSGKHVTVLAIPLRPDIDDLGERYYYFEADDRYRYAALDWVDMWGRIRAVETEHEA